MRTYKEFAPEQEEKLKELGYKTTIKNTWYKCYGHDNHIGEQGFFLVLNPLGMPKGEVVINYEVTFEVSKDEVDDAQDVSQIYEDITVLIQNKIIFEE